MEIKLSNGYGKSNLVRLVITVIILEKTFSVFNSHLDRFILTNSKHPFCTTVTITSFYSIIMNLALCNWS